MELQTMRMTKRCQTKNFKRSEQVPSNRKLVCKSLRCHIKSVNLTRVSSLTLMNVLRMKSMKQQRRRCLARRLSCAKNVLLKEIVGLSTTTHLRDVFVLKTLTIFSPCSAQKMMSRDVQRRLLITLVVWQISSPSSRETIKKQCTLRKCS